MMSNPAKKKKVRQGHRAYIAKIIGNVSGIVGEYDPSQEVRLKQLKVTLQEKLDTLKTLDEEIFETIEEDGDREEEIEDAGQFREKIHEAIMEIDCALHTPDEPKIQEVPTRTMANTGNVGKQAKLSELVLKKFLGEPTEWQSFWDSFRNAVHENSGLSDIDKLNYLKSLLENTAASTIADLPLTSANYEAAVELLEQRFGNKQVIISSHIDGLLKLTPMGSSADVKKLRQTYNTIEAHVRGLQAARQQILKKQGHCFLCLKQNHIARDCESRNCCFKCSGRHHISLCKINHQRIGAPSQTQTNAPGNKMPESGASQTSFLHVSAKDSILLQTAQAWFLSSLVCLSVCLPISICLPICKSFSISAFIARKVKRKVIHSFILSL